MLGCLSCASCYESNLIDFHITPHSMTHSNMTSMPHSHRAISFAYGSIYISHISHAHGAYRTSSCPDLPGQRPAEWDPTALTTIALASGSGGEVTKGRQMHKVIS